MADDPRRAAPLFGDRAEPADDDTALDDGSLAAEYAARFAGGEDPAAPRLELRLVVADADVLAALRELPEGSSRDAYALDALRIGVLALRNAAGRIDAERVRNEADHLLQRLQEALRAHAESTRQGAATVLREYFDPQNGRFSERVARLVSDDGELATLLREQVHGDASPLARMLASQLGADSPLMRQLDPDCSAGLLARLRKSVEEELARQREVVLREFSLDQPTSALRRLVDELSGKHGDLSRDLRGKIDEVVKEFSLDNDESALARLVRRVQQAQQTITAEFSLDNDGSALARMKAHLETILSAHLDANQRFQEEVKVALAGLAARREAEARGAEHGVAFEEAVGEFLHRDAHERGDLCQATGATTGAVAQRKWGDFVIELGPDSVAAGARIVFEAKDDKSYSLAAAIEELDQARKNRRADFGVFVMAVASAQRDFPRFRRRGPDVFVQWDPEDASTDPYLMAAIEVARACAIEFRRGRVADVVDLEAIEKAINAVEKQAEGLEKIEKPAQTIKSSAETILERVRIDRDALLRQVGALRKQAAALGAAAEA